MSAAGRVAARLRLDRQLRRLAERLRLQRDWYLIVAAGLTLSRSLAVLGNGAEGAVIGLITRSRLMEAYHQVLGED